MLKEVIRRTASDNKYLHKDFHLLLNMGIEYLGMQYGDDAVTEYLEQFAKCFYAPLREELNTIGLSALKEYYEKIYEIENSHIKTNLLKDELIIEISICPAVQHMKENNIKPSKLYYETTKRVNETICKDSEYNFELMEYEDETGKAKLRFFRR